MRLHEFADPNAPKLLALTTWLADRAKDENARGQISQDAFIDVAKSLEVNVTKENLGDLIAREPLKNVLEPLDPNSGVVRFKGNLENTTGMTVDQAQEVVKSNAKAAMKRGMKESIQETALPKAQLDRFRDAVLKTTDLTQKKRMIKSIIDLALINEKHLYNPYVAALNQSQDPDFLNNMTDRVVGYYLSQTNQM